MIHEDILYIVMPAYNEGKNIEPVVRAWHRMLATADPRSMLVVADSGSTDDTHDVLMRLSGELGSINIISDTAKEHGPKVIALYKYAIASGAQYIFQTDSDGQTNTEDFLPFWKERVKYNAIIGYRRKRGDGISRQIIEHIVCILLKLYFGIAVPDANAPFRLMKSSELNRYIGRLPDDYNIPNIMLTAFFAHESDKAIFKEISFTERLNGHSSVNLRRIIRIGAGALKGFTGFKKYFV